MGDHYILDADQNPVPCDLMTWARWLEGSSRVLEKTHSEDGSIEVSTVFLGLDHGFGGGPPVLWETMIFGGEHDQYQERYTSKSDALKGHQKAVDLMGGGIDETSTFD